MLDLSNWKLTLPVDASGKLEGKAAEIEQPALATYRSEWFYPNADGVGYVFVCPTRGARTGNTENSRTELREKNADGSLAAWSTKQGKHSMVFTVSVDELPKGSRRKCAVGQIHGKKDDVTTYRFEQNPDGLITIWISKGDTSQAYKVTDRYRLGDRITLGFHTESGTVRYTVNGQMIPFEVQSDDNPCYYKVGAYPQTKQESVVINGKSDFAQVKLYACTVTHEAASTPVVTPDVTAQQIADLQRQVAALTTTVQRQEQRWTALGKAVAL